MSIEPSALEVHNLLGGRWEAARIESCDSVYNPSTGEVIARVPLSGAEDVAAVVGAAAAALPAWSNTTVVQRARVMFRYRELLERHFEELAALITREHGKTLGEARAELRRGIEVVEFACGAPSLIMGQSLPNIAPQVDSELMRQPVGVCAGITPYNFPAMIPLWMFPVALVCGNTFVLKPSEKVPLTAVRLGTLLLEAGIPPGVFNIVHGGRECVEAILDHPLVAAISFVGSTPVARAIYRRGTQAGKRVQAAGGAKNHFVVMPDADPQHAAQALAESAYGCAGQRCMATSVAVPVGNIAEPLVEQLCEHASRLRVGPTDGNEEVDVGPLIRREHVERVSRYLDFALDEGAAVVLDGRRDFDGNGFLLGPSIVDRVRPEMRVAREEVFGPLLSVIRATDLDSVIRLGQTCQYGNGASIFTRDGFAAREFQRHFNAGMIGINVGVPAPMAWFPFSGWNGSFFGDLHVQGMEGIQFYTRQKVTMSRWLAPSVTTADDPLWKGGS